MNALKSGVKHKKCSKCNADFTCNDSGDSCWCNNHKLTKEQLMFLKDNYENCLCEDCIVLVVKEFK
ncbi:MAG: cysteine-rich CWC family protein [Vicingaceae bacterium]